ncbi:hypothetical protein V1517DRAFT_341325 [Lipomyces orientalis]|uniref:Uncharacterized protein n=1 Tax=Lipomyces orientalis TaxID=1233043 RepID=A0ACC3TG46_9ASCO
MFNITSSCHEQYLSEKSNALNVGVTLTLSGCKHRMGADLTDDSLDEARNADHRRDELPLQFITITDLADAKRDLASRRLVRAQARKSAHRSSTNALTSVAGNSEGPVTSKFKLSSWQRRSSKKKLQEIALPAVLSDSLNHLSHETVSPRLSAELAPINVLPVPMNPMTQELLRFYHFDLHTNSFALNPQGDWFKFARTDPAALHAFLSAVAVLRNLQLGIADSMTVFYHRSEAVRFINRDLIDPARQLSDGLIATAAVLVNAEAIESDFERASIHMRGLVLMVQLRGGLESFEHSKTIQRVITWADFCFASTWCLPLSFPLLKSLSSPVLPSDPTVFQPAKEQRNLQHLDIAEPHTSVLKVLRMLRSISNAISAFPDVGGDRVAISKFYLSGGV